MVSNAILMTAKRNRYRKTQVCACYSTPPTDFAVVTLPSTYVPQLILVHEHLLSTHTYALRLTGIEFRVTEEYDEDSPFSRPPEWKPTPSKQDLGPSAPQPKEHAASHDHTSDSQSSLSGGQASSVISTADSTSNGSAPASASPSTADTAAVESRNITSAHAEAAAQASSDGAKARDPDVGRGQVYSDADTPQRLPVGIEFSDQPDSDQPSSTAVMDTVNQKPGLRRTLDGKGRVAPDRDAEEQGLSPPSESQTGLSGDPSDSEGSGPGVAWWDSATASVSGAFESVKSAVSTGFHSFSKGQSDSQQPGNPPVQITHFDQQLSPKHAHCQSLLCPN